MKITVYIFYITTRLYTNKTYLRSFINKEWLDNTIYVQDNIKCIAATEQMIINVGADNLYRVTIIHYVQNIYWHG